ncbi:hypothetical protein [Metabacillus sp. RGM 3146]|uniref:hypothetical protein n=1 Tax=Metabacillus sp. RGM 3146 TaxID=3401092 RepID=UPI003B9B159E
MFYQLRMAEMKDLNKLKAFMEKAGVITAGVDETVDCFMIMEDDKEDIVASLGLERFQEDGLLRALVVSEKLDQAHILSLFKSAGALGKKLAVTKLFLITNKQSSMDFLRFAGFEAFDGSVPEHLMKSEHVRLSMSKKGATLMAKNS